MTPEGSPLVAGGGAACATPPDPRGFGPNPGRGSRTLRPLPGSDDAGWLPVVSPRTLHHRLQAATPPGSTAKRPHYHMRPDIDKIAAAMGE